MRRWIRGSVLFAAGLLLGMLTIKSIEAQQDKGIGVRVNHVGIYVKNLQESVDFYTRTLGMREGFVMRDKMWQSDHHVRAGRQVHIPRTRAGERRSPCRDQSRWFPDRKHQRYRYEWCKWRHHRARAYFCWQRSTSLPPSISDPNGVRLEMLEFAPGSMQRGAIETYK